jgi:hypothetical protein
MIEHPAKYTQTYRLLGTAANTATVATFCTAMTDKINSHAGRRVDCTDDTTGLSIVGKEIPECCTALTDIDKFRMTEFDVYFNYVDSDGNWQTIDSTSTTVTTTGPTYGSGNWEQVRDMEKDARGHIGVSNKTHFPVLEPASSVVITSFYDIISIEHDLSYLAPNNQGFEKTGVTTEIAMATAETGTNAGNATTLLLAVLNPWMASCPGAFPAISV